MQAWQLAAGGAAVFVTGHYLFLRAASGRIGDSLGALVLETAAALGVALVYLAGARGGGPATKAGVLYALLSGLSISGASILLFQALRRGGPLASTGTIVMSGGVVMSALLSPFLFRETMTLRRAVGVGLGVVAMIVLATENVEGT